MNILLATAHPDLDQSISSSLIDCNFWTAGIKEEILDTLKNAVPDIAVVSQFLPGRKDLLDVLYALRMEGTRVIFLAPGFNSSDPAMQKVLAFGIYDLVTGNFSLGEVIDRIQNPATFKEAQQIFKGEKPVRTELATSPLLSKVFKLQQHQKFKGSTKRDTLGNVIAVWSPTHSGSTMIAVNLAAALVESGSRVVLVDFDVKSLALHSWLKVPPEEDSLPEAIKVLKNAKEEFDLLNYCYQTPELPGLWVMAADPVDFQPVIKEKPAAQLLQLLAEEVDYVIIDASSHLTDPQTKAALKYAEKVFLVTDLDFHHLVILHKQLGEMEDKFNPEKFCVVVNKYLETSVLNKSDVEKAAQMPVDFCIPDAADVVFESVKGGIPAVLFSAALKTAFRQLLNVIN